MSNSAGAAARRLKLLQLVPEPLPTFRADVATLFGKYLPRYGVDCHVVGSASAAPLGEHGFASARRPAHGGGRLQRELNFLRLCARSLFQARRGEYDVIQVRDMVSIGLLGSLAARLKGSRFAYWMSYPMCEGRIERARRELKAGGGLRFRFVLLKGLVEQFLLNRIVLPSADHIFVQSDAMLAKLASEGVPAHKMTPVPMGVDSDAVAARPQARRPEGWEERPLLAYLGTLDHSRDMNRVLDALQLVRRTVPDAVLLLIGDSPAPRDVPRLLEHAASLGLSEAVRITGWLPSAEAWSLLTSADAAISYIPRGTLYDVSSPTKLLEYLALQVPCVGNDNPDQQKVLSESGAGWLTESSPAALATAICAIFGDKTAARLRAQAGPAYIDAHRSYRVIAEQTAQSYFAICAPALAPAAAGKNS
ncbi:glycosyltransferase [Massilia sp. NR 4-1]|uniref:glycosyltransferase n=1 Tax=Massilia sp. NR 4-1 TaxID=1678028 RepID=UPI00067E12F8|nr:glycosyltransferase [Massilia sp. NR 4-1]